MLDHYSGFLFWIPIPDSHRHSYSGFTYHSGFRFPFQISISFPIPDSYSHSEFPFPFRIPNAILIPDSYTHSHSGLTYPFPFWIPIPFPDSIAFPIPDSYSYSGFIFPIRISIPIPDFHSHSGFPFPFRISIPIQTQVCEFNAVQVRCLKFKLHAKVQCRSSSLKFKFKVTHQPN